MKKFLFLILILHSPLAVSSELVEVYDCKSGREYIASYRYFSEHKELAVSDERKRDLSYKISSGCTHAAWRFINVFEILYHAKFPSALAINTGLEFVNASDEKTQAFLSIFEMSFVRSFLDFDAKTSLDIAKSLSIGMGDFPVWLKEDFEKLAKFCSSQQDLAINKSECAGFVVELVKLNANKRDREGKVLSSGIAEPFISGYAYLTQNEDGPKLVSNEAIKELMAILKVSPYGIDNFEKMYEYATNEMKLERNEAIQLSTEIALKSSKKIRLEKKL